MKNSGQERWLYNDQILGNLGKMVKRERRRQNLTQRELADLAGLSRAIVLKLENHSSDIKLSSLLKIMNFLRLDLALKVKEGGG